MDDNAMEIQLRHALDTMYSNAGQLEKKQATRLMEEFQKSEQAWEMAHKFLGSVGESVPVQMFGAQVLRWKVSFDLPQLGEGQVGQLRGSILGFLEQYGDSGHRTVRTQLCVALAQLALQDLAWKGAIEEIVARLGRERSTIPCLLEFLKILPEEVSDSKKTSLTNEEFFARTKELVVDNVEKIMMLFKSLIEGDAGSDAELRGLVLDALNSWIQECPLDSILQIDSLMSLVFESLTNENTFDRSIECLCTILGETKHNDNSQIIDALFQQLLKFHAYMTSHPDKLEDPETFDAMVRLYVEAGEAWHVSIAKNPKHFKPLVEILLECCKYEEDLDVVKYTFNFWYLLKQLIIMPKFQESRAELQDVYLRLISIIIQHLTYPLNVPDDNLFGGDKEQEDKFKEFRYDMGDVLKDCCVVVGSTKALGIPFVQLQNILSENSSDKSWQHLEAPLFSMRTMAKEVSTREKNILPVIMNFLVQLPEHPKVRYAATLVLGRYTEWTAKNPEYLEPQLNYIIKGFELASVVQNKDIVVAATHSLMYFCRDCSGLLVNYLEQLYMLYGEIRDKLDIESTYELADGLAHVVKQMPTDSLYKTTETFLSPTIEILESSLKSSNADDESANVIIADQVEVITKFIGVMRCSDFEQPSYPVADLFRDKLWILSQQLLGKFGRSLKVSERVTKLIKTSIQSFSTYLNPILSDIANLLHQGFKETTFGCYLWVSGILIREFGEYSSDELKQAVFQFGLTQGSEFFNVLSSNSNIKEIPDVVEDFFRMVGDLLMFFPYGLVTNTDFLASTVNASVLVLSTINEFNPLIACLHFLIDLALWGKSPPPISLFEDDPLPIQEAVRQFLVTNNIGANLLKVVLHGLLVNLHADLEYDSNELMLTLLIVTPPDVAIQWLSESVQSLPNVNAKEIQKLMQSSTTALYNKDNRRVASSLRDFVDWYSRKNHSSHSDF